MSITRRKQQKSFCYDHCDHRTGRDWNPFICVVKEGFWASSGQTLSRMPRFTPDRVCRVSSRLFAGAISHCLATLRACEIMYRPKQFCAWHATSETEFHPFQTGADHGAILLSPGCTRFIQTVVCPLEMPSTALRIGPCGERTATASSDSH